MAAQAVDASLDWEVRDIIGKRVVDGDVHYLVDWRPTLVPEHALGNVKELVDEFEARFRAQLTSETGLGGLGLKQGERAVAGGAPGKTSQKRLRGRPWKQT